MRKVDPCDFMHMSNNFNSRTGLIIEKCVFHYRTVEAQPNFGGFDPTELPLRLRVAVFELGSVAWLRFP